MVRNRDDHDSLLEEEPSLHDQGGVSVQHLVSLLRDNELRYHYGHDSIEAIGSEALDVARHRFAQIAVRRLDYLQWMWDPRLEPLVTQALGLFRVETEGDGADVGGRQCLGVFNGL